MIPDVLMPVRAYGFVSQTIGYPPVNHLPFFGLHCEHPVFGLASHKTNSITPHQHSTARVSVKHTRARGCHLSSAVLMASPT